MKNTIVFVALGATLAAGSARAKEWQIIATFPGRTAAAIFADGFESGNVSRIDFDGDTVGDKVFFKPVTGGRILTVISGSDPAQRWALPCQPFGPSEKFMGFYNFDGVVNSGNPKEVVVAQQQGGRFLNPTVLYDIDLKAGTCRVSVPDGSTILIGGIDIDKDGDLELVLADTAKNEIQVRDLR